MPIIEVMLVEGRDPRALQDFAGSITEAAREFLDVPASSVRVLVHQIPAPLFFIGGRTHADVHDHSITPAEPATPETSR